MNLYHFLWAFEWSITLLYTTKTRNPGQIYWLQSLPTLCISSTTNTALFRTFPFTFRKLLSLYNGLKFCSKSVKDSFPHDSLAKWHLYSYQQRLVPLVSSLRPSRWYTNRHHAQKVLTRVCAQSQSEIYCLNWGNGMLWKKQTKAETWKNSPRLHE